MDVRTTRSVADSLKHIFQVDIAMSRSAVPPIVASPNIQTEPMVEQKEPTAGKVLSRVEQILLVSTMACAGLLNVRCCG